MATTSLSEVIRRLRGAALRESQLTVLATMTPTAAMASRRLIFEFESIRSTKVPIREPVQKTKTSNPVESGGHARQGRSANIMIEP